jgi:hypothetical protein
MNTTQMPIAQSKKIGRGTEMILNNKSVWVIKDREDGLVAICNAADLKTEHVDDVWIVLKSDLTPLLRVRSSIVVKAVEPIKKVSSGHLKKLAVYRVVRDEYLAEHPVCEFPGCNCTNVSVHHKAGRIGSCLINKDFFCSLCDPHHRFVEVNPLQAKAMGLSEDRL